MNIIFIILTLILIIYIYHIWERYVCGSIHLISSNNAKELLTNNKFEYVIDVRTKFEYKLGHLKGSVNIPINNIKEIVPKVIKNKFATILIYCNSGNRARQATDYLIKMGYTNVNYISELYTSLQ
jgi:hypothetical protein